MFSRRSVLVGAGVSSVAVFAPGAASAQDASSRYRSPEAQASRAPISAPRGRAVRVAFVVGTGNANVMDVAGPWEVFQDTMVGDRMMFELFTVGESEASVRMTGGLHVIPDYTVANAPAPDIIVIPAVRSTELTRDWITSAHENTSVTMSVCTGAFVLASTGLLDGSLAATHHDFWDSFERRFPNVELQRGLRFVDNGRIASAGGLTSGVDLALHIVERYFGRDAAQRTADYMEYQSDTWKVEA